MGTIFTVTFPDIGEGVVEGEVIEWHKKVGDSVKQDEPVVIVMTDKATVELPAPHPGKFAKQYFSPGEMAIKDQPLYDIELTEEITKEQNLCQEKEVTQNQNNETKIQNYPSGTANNLKQNISSSKAPSSQPTSVDQISACKNLATPKVRGLAKQLGIPLSGIHGTGKGGRVTPQDLCQNQNCGNEKVSTSLAPLTPIWQLPGDQEIPIIGIKARMAKKMTESREQIPSFSYFEEVEVTRLIQLKTGMKAKAAKEGVHLTYMPFILKALSACIVKFPFLNSSFDKEHSKLIVHQQQNIGIAVATSLGLIVPVLKSIEKLGLETLIRNYEELILRAQEGKLHPSDMKEATMTVSNFGSNGSHGLWATPVINYPEAAILAIGKIHPQAVVRNGEIVVREILNLSWSFDHRIIDGEAAAHISQYFCNLLQNPAALL